MRLGELVAVLEDRSVSGDLNLELTSLVSDSRQVKPGSLFACLKGLQSDGHHFIDQAIKSGAVALLVQQGDWSEIPSHISVICVPDSRKALSHLSAKFYDYPSQKLTIIGITGTNGKTTTTYLSESILKEAGFKVSRLSTITYHIGDEEETAWQTTPEALQLQAILAQAVASGSSHLVMEASSHGLALHRTIDCEFDLGVFTNLSQDHLDFHQTLNNYIKAKLLLFESLGKESKKDFPKAAIINLDDPVSQQIISCLSVPAITYSLRSQADIYASDIKITPTGSSFFLSQQGYHYH